MQKLSRDEAALLKAVCRNKADDTPRLVYADWLDEHVRPERAEFIRLQCALAAEGYLGIPNDPQPQFDPRQYRINFLWDQNREQWSREVPKWATRFPVSPFVRGFCEHFMLVAAPFLRYGPQLLDRTPVTSLKLVQLRNVLDDLVSCVWLRETQGLNLGAEGLGDDWVAGLLRSEWLTATRHLDLGGNDLRDDSARALARCSYLSELRWLGLSGNRITLNGVQALASSRHLNPKSVIDLQGNPALDDRPEAVRRILGDRGRMRPTFPR